MARFCPDWMPPVTAVPPLQRRLSRLERQGRVGILRNTNDPPRPPARKAALMARWPTLRSARRPGIAPAPEAQPVEMSLSPAPDALKRDAAGQIAGIDIAGLMASVEGIGTQPPARAAFAAQMRAEAAPPDPASRRRARPSALIPEAWAELSTPPLRATEKPPPPRLGLSTTLAAGVVLALVVLVLVPALVSL